MVKCVKDKHYTVYNKPELEGAWTFRNEMVFSHDIEEIDVFVSAFSQ